MAEIALVKKRESFALPADPQPSDRPDTRLPVPVRERAIRPQTVTRPAERSPLARWRVAASAATIWQRAVGLVGAVRDTGQHGYAALNRATDGLPGYLARAWQDFNRRDAQRAAALVYYAIFSVFPLLLLAVALVSGLVGPALAQEQVLDAIQLFFPAETVSVITDNVQTALAQRESFGLVAAAGLAWSGLGLFTNLIMALDAIFQPAYTRPMWQRRALALGLAAGLSLLLLTALLAALAVSLVNLVAPTYSVVPLVLLTALVSPFGIGVTIFALLFRTVPRQPVRWNAIWPAALLGGLGWTLTQQAFVWYLENVANFSIIYGSLGAVIVLLLWAYLSAAILLLGAEVCAALNKWLAAREKA